MFDYDARPVTPQVVHRGPTGVVARLPAPRLPQPQRRPLRMGRDRRRATGAKPARRRATSARTASRSVSCPTGSRLDAATVEGVALGLGMVSPPSLAEYDLTIVGAGPGRARRRGVRRLRGTAGGGDRGGRARRSSGHDLDDRELPRLSPRDQRQRAGDAGHRAGPTLRRRGAAGAAARRHRHGRRRLSSLDCRTARPSGRDRCWSPAASTGVASTWPASTTCSARASTTARARARRCRAAGAAWRSSAAETPPAKPSCGSRATPPTSPCWSAAPPSAPRCRSTWSTKVTNLENVDVRTGTEVVGLEADGRLRAVMLSTHGRLGAARGCRSTSLFVCIGGVPRTNGLADARARGRRRRLPAHRRRRQCRRAARSTNGRCRVHRCRSRPTGPGCSPPATCAAGRSSVARRRSARDPWPSRWSTAASPSSAATEMSAP